MQQGIDFRLRVDSWNTDGAVTPEVVMSDPVRTGGRLPARRGVDDAGGLVACRVGVRRGAVWRALNSQVAGGWDAAWSPSDGCDMRGAGAERRPGGYAAVSDPVNRRYVPLRERA
jgi:hypothetical protein